MSEESQNAEPEEGLEEESIIPEEDFREAIAACREDPELDRYFKMAPPGAKLFIGLGFYSTHFGDKVDPRQYAECQAEIEPALTVSDLQYLIRFERDKNTKTYLRELLARREAGAVPEETASPEPADVPIAPPKRKRRRRLPELVDLRAEDRPRETCRSVPLALKIAAALVLVLGGAVAVYFSHEASGRSSKKRPSVAVADASDSGRQGPTKTNEVARAGFLKSWQGAHEGEGETVAPARDDAGEEDAPPQVAEMPETPPETPAAATADAPSRSRGRKPRIVLTDGKKIVRRPGGVIEVPRVFSCAGAGIKPFWVYGARPEVEAAKEKKAREEWQALVRQAEGESP